jgi:hypothetical protein
VLTDQRVQERRVLMRHRPSRLHRDRQQDAGRDVRHGEGLHEHGRMRRVQRRWGVHAHQQVPRRQAVVRVGRRRLHGHWAKCTERDQLRNEVLLLQRHVLGVPRRHDVHVEQRAVQDGGVRVHDGARGVHGDGQQVVGHVVRCGSNVQRG